MGAINKIIQKQQIKYIYKIECLANKCIYIGQTYDIKRRFRDHKKSLVNQSHQNKRLQEDFNLYGMDAFKFSILEKVLPNIAYEKEDYWINYYGGIFSDLTYNMTTSNELNNEVKYNIGKSNKNKVRSDEFRLSESINKQNLYNSQQGEVIKNKISKSMKEYYNTEQGLQQLEKQRIYAKINYSGESNPMYGKHHTNETKKKISDTKKQMYKDNEYVPWNKGKKGLYHATKETRLKQQMASTKYTSEMIEILRDAYNELGTYSAVAKKFNMNSNCVSRLIRFGTTQMKHNDL